MTYAFGACWLKAQEPVQVSHDYITFSQKGPVQFVALCLLTQRPIVGDALRPAVCAL